MIYEIVYLWGFGGRGAGETLLEYCSANRGVLVRLRWNVAFLSVRRLEVRLRGDGVTTRWALACLM